MNIQYKDFEVLYLPEELKDDSKEVTTLINNIMFPEHNKSILLICNSNGGNPYVGFSIIDSMALSPVDIYTLSIGATASTASIVFLMGKKRFVSPKSTLLIHQISMAFFAMDNLNIKKFKEETKECERLQVIFDEIILSKTQISKDMLKDYYTSETDIYFTPKESIEYGLADKIIKNNKDLVNSIKPSKKTPIIKSGVE